MTVKYNFKYKPFDHQQVALDHGCFEEEFGYFMEMGTGKSKVLIDNIGMLFLSGQVNFALGLALGAEGVRCADWIGEEGCRGCRYLHRACNIKGD